MATQPLSSSPDSATEPRIVITRVFDAPRSRVFKAWTDPEQLKQWFGPRTFTNPHLTADVRPGGTLLGAMRSPDGQDYWYKGVYREIVEPERIVYVDMFADEHGNTVPASHYGMSEDFPLETLVTVTFEDLGDKTRMTLEHVGQPVSEGENAAAGWSESFDKLAEYLKTS